MTIPGLEVAFVLEEGWRAGLSYLGWNLVDGVISCRRHICWGQYLGFTLLVEKKARLNEVEGLLQSKENEL